MFMLRNVSKYLFGDSSKESIIDVPQGQLFLVRPLSVKGYSELIFKDSTTSIRRTGQQYQYQLNVQRVYEEGEEELLAEEQGEDAEIEALTADRDEKTFLLDEELQFRTEIRDTGEKVFAWRDLSGDEGDLWEFVCDHSTPASTVETFELIALQCQFERKYRKPHEQATNGELEEFRASESTIPDAGSVITTPLASPSIDRDGSKVLAWSAHDNMARKTAVTATPKGKEAVALAAPGPSAVIVHPEARETLAESAAELWLFNLESGEFLLQDAGVTALVTDLGNWKYWLQIKGKNDWLGQAIIPDINPVFNFEYKSFIFNQYDEDGSAYSWLLKFKETEIMEMFQEGLMQALWEHLHEMKWGKATKTDQDYVLDAFNDLTMEDAPTIEEEDEDEYDESEDDSTAQQSEHYDSDESEDDVEVRDKDGNVNSQLAVGYKHDRSFVVRGSKIGVFKHTPDNHLQFTTNISKVATPKGKLFSPTKVMLHQEDQNMILQNADNPNSLYKMDLEYGKVVDEWKVHDDIPVKIFAPESKFAQMSGEQTFLGLSNNALFRVDPRLAGNKLVESEKQGYASNVDFSAAATTKQGYVAAASNKGSIRLFDRLGIRAKTEIPALGDPIIGVDVSADGRWILATTRTYLLLIDAEQKSGKNEGKLGFEKSFAKDSKPQPKRLALTPSHVAQFQHETKVPISFTPAHFNAGVDSDETTIITATGPFIISWSLKKVMAGRKDPYSIKRYSEEVKADNFKYGSDKNLIVALPNEVNMVAKRALQRPTRESIAGPGLRTPRKSGRLGRNEVVDSPY
ncbi:vacuolar import and degradation protein [Pseudovirgaria hyperparasitica]|uniref:Vacuolar import and degradation protein n=1 Tax=Pseudovirgaria hyperparasitica TaxID=470096 RepID=A0A6A6WDE0_9PEZI|nr:vacuolar import and degradation protein [Pseudovirgaria hyperparasitica]KAF2759980.1 vacuolar import and degradation protein [Pseudovirgaria hyperparasitica]